MCVYIYFRYLADIIKKKNNNLKVYSHDKKFSWFERSYQSSECILGFDKELEGLYKFTLKHCRDSSFYYGKKNNYQHWEKKQIHLQWDFNAFQWIYHLKSSPSPHLLLLKWECLLLLLQEVACSWSGETFHHRLPLLILDIYAFNLKMCCFECLLFHQLHFLSNFLES